MTISLKSDNIIEFTQKFSPSLNNAKYVVVDCLTNYLTPFEQISFMRSCKSLAKLVHHWQIFSVEFKEAVTGINRLKEPVELTFQDKNLIRFLAIAKINGIFVQIGIKSKIDTKIQLSILINCLSYCPPLKQAEYLEQALLLIDNETSPYVQLDCRCLLLKTLAQINPKLCKKFLKIVLKQISKLPKRNENKERVGNNLYTFAKVSVSIKSKMIEKAINLMPVEHPKSVQFFLLVSRNCKSKTKSLKYLNNAIDITTHYKQQEDSVSVLNTLHLLPSTPIIEEIRYKFLNQIVDPWDSRYLESLTVTEIPLLIELYDHYVNNTYDTFALAILVKIKTLFLECVEKPNLTEEQIDISYKALEFIKSVDQNVYFSCLKRFSRLTISTNNAVGALKMFNKFYLLWTLIPTNIDHKKLKVNLRMCTAKCMNIITSQEKYSECLAMNFLTLMPKN